MKSIYNHSALLFVLFVLPVAALAGEPPSAAKSDAAPTKPAGSAAPAPAEAASDNQPAEPKVKVTVFALPHPDVSDADMVQIVRELENGLKKNERLEYKDLDARLSEFAQDLPAEQIEAARSALKDGQGALAEHRIADAVQKLESAVAGLAKVLPFIKKQELADAMASLAIAQYEGGDKKMGHEEFLELLTWRSDYLYDAERLPAKYLPQFEAAQREVEKARRGGFAIHSTPEGAQAYVDGKYVGVTPCIAEGQPVGKHFVTLKKEGYKKAVAAAVANFKKQTPVAVALDRSEKYLLVEQAREKVEKTLGQEQIDPDADNLKQVLYIDQAVFLKATATGADRIATDSFLYDLRTRHLLSEVKQEVAKTGIEAGLASVATDLYKGVSYEGELATPVDVVTPPTKQAVRKPIYKQWWLWTALGAIVVGAVAAPVAIVETMPPGCGSDMTCLRLLQ